MIMDALLRTSRRPYARNPRPRAAAVRERNCSVARVVSILSDAWTFLIIREAFFGARRFESFRAALGLPRATLTERLKRLTRQGIFRQHRASPASRRAEYRLTKAGLELYPSFMAMMQFGDRWLSGGKNNEVGPLIRKFLQGRDGVEVVDRMRMLRLIENMTIGRNAVGYLTESLHGAGSLQAQRIQIARGMKIEEKKARARHLAGIAPR
jgi:DNA-binding HxlR family transcriptional regulator